MWSVQQIFYELNEDSIERNPFGESNVKKIFMGEKPILSTIP